MLTFPDKQQLTELIQKENGACASILMRTHQSGRETTQNPIRFKNLISQAIEQARKSESPLLGQLESIAALEHDTDFWQHQNAGLAIYLSEGFEQRMSLSHAPAEFVSLSEHFHVLAIASAACGKTDVRALAISWERSRLFGSDGNTTTEIIDDAFPAAMDELVAERDPEEQLQFTSHSQSGKGGTSTAMFHGQGEGEGKIEADRNQYLSRVGEMIGDRMYNTDQTLIVVATEEVAGHFEAAAESVKVSEVIHVSPDGLDEDELEQRITDAAKKHNQNRDAITAERLSTALANGTGSTDLNKILAAATEGRVDTLLLGTDTSSADRLNDAVRLTLLSSGKVRQLHASDDAQAAIFRY
jgi:hypothetical protein